MNPLGALILAVLVFLVLGATRRVALLAMMAGVLYLTQGPQINVLGLNLFAVRFLELAGFVRVMARHEFSFRQLNGIDRALIWLYGYITVVFLLRSTEGVAYQIGMFTDAFLCYFAFRGLLGDMEDFCWFLRAFVILLVPYTLLVLIESVTGHNPLSILGGITGGSVWLRHGFPRCFGSFRQPDTLGMFAASFLPLYIGLACIIRERRRAVLGICLCIALVVVSNSGGAASGAAVGLLCWGLWRFRMSMRMVRWSIVGMIAVSGMVMKAPIWYIFQHVSSITGGDGWHRSYLIDVTYKHIGQWWLAGMPINETSDWFPYQNAATASADITNLFVAFGLTAGLGAIALFILLLTRAFSRLGSALAIVRSPSCESGENEFMLWGLGVMLTVHIINWFGITYFDQMYVVWFMQLAAISGLSEKCIAAKSVEAEKPNEMEGNADETENVLFGGAA